MPPQSARELANAVRARTLPRLKSLRNRLANQPSQQRTVFVAGVHRSGTNMIMHMLERSWETDVFDEGDNRAFDDFIMRDETVIKALAERSTAPVMVIKALHEAHKLLDLMETFAPAKLIWMFRSYPDVINSSLKHWPGKQDGRRNKIDAIVRDRNSADWRGSGMTDETYRMVCAHYHPGLDDASAEALFWVYRNQLLFDQGLDSDTRALVVSYERLVSDADYAASLSKFLGLRFTKPMLRIPFGESVRKHPAQSMDAGIHELCEQMWQRLELVHAQHAKRLA